MLDVCAIVDIGLVRTKNDDRILLGKTVYSEGEYYLENIDDNFICAVSDGIGGYSHGDLAAEMTLHEFIDIREFSEETVLKVINISNDKVIKKQKENKEFSKMGATLSGVWIQNNDLITFNIGDSRVYQMRKGFLKQLSQDHSQVQRMVDAKLITREEAKLNPLRNIITEYIGKTDLHPDVVFQKNLINNGDYFLICSDGITDLLDEKRIETILNSNHDLKIKVKLIIEEVKKKGGHDNMSIIMVYKH